MSVVEQKPMNMTRTYITLAVVVVLIAAAMAYSQGWFNRLSSSYETDNNRVSTEQTVDQKAEMGAAPITQPTTSPTATPTK
jgi:hypothetical protein